MDKLFKNVTVENNVIVKESDCILYFTPSAFVDLKLDDSKTIFTMDQFLLNLPYQDLTGENTERTELENMTAQAKVYQTVINENLDNPLIRPIGDELNNISFCLHAGLTDEERKMPQFLLPKGGSILQAYNVIQWNCLNLKKIDLLKLRPYLGYQPVKIICKTLKNTTQRAKMILHHPMQKHMKPRFPLLNSKQCYETVSSGRFYANVKDIKMAWYAVMSFMVVQQDALIYLDTRKGEMGTTMCIEIFVRIMGFQLY